MIKFKQFDVGDSGYEEQIEKFQIEHPQAEFLQITGGHMSPEQIWFKYDDGAEQPKLSILKKIAEELLEFRKSLSDPDTELLGWTTIINALYQYPEFSEDFRDWWDDRKAEANNLAIAYLNPLTRPFVEVEE